MRLSMLTEAGYEPAAQDFGQRLRSLLVVLVDRIGVHPGSHVAAVVGALLVEHDQLIWSYDRQLAQQHLVDERENGRICADSEREGQDRDNREQRAAAESPERVAKVGQEGAHRDALTVEHPERFTLFSARWVLAEIRVIRVPRNAASPAGLVWTAIQNDLRPFDGDKSLLHHRVQLRQERFDLLWRVDDFDHHW